MILKFKKIIRDLTQTFHNIFKLIEPSHLIFLVKDFCFKFCLIRVWDKDECDNGKQFVLLPRHFELLNRIEHCKLSAAFLLLLGQ